MSSNTFSSASKSNRTLQSLRYTMAATDNTEAFTSVLDLSAADIYSQQNFLPKTALPYSGSSQHLDFITASINDADANIAQYYFRVTMSRSDVTIDNNKAEAWLAISGSGYDPVSINSGGGVNTQNISPLQLTDWISNKYITASEAGFKSEGDPPGYNIQLYIDGVSTTAGFQFDYKTGVLQFVDNSVAPSKTSLVAVSGYRYVGQTLESFVSSSGGGSGVGFPFSGSAVITGSLLISGSNNEPVDLIVSGGLSVSEGIVASTGSISDFTATKLTSVSASIDHLTVNVLISGSTIVTSGSNTFGDGMEDVQTLIGTTKITGSAQVTGSLNVNGVFTLPGITDVSASISTLESAESGIFKATGSIQATTNTLQITGSTLQSTPFASPGAGAVNPTSSGASNKYAMLVSQSLWHYNANVGVPSTNPWGNSGLEGSYFSNFDHNTDISVMLRFVAGLLSSSAPNASPNTQTYNNITPTLGGTQTGNAPAGYVPTGFTDTTVSYLNTKGFANAGEPLFNGISPIHDYSASELYKRNYTSVAAGPTSVSSSNDNQLFGLGTINTAFNVSGGLNWYYSDNSTKSQTTISSSQNFLTRTGAGVSNPGLTIGNIVTVNPAVIPNAFQDGKFSNIFEAEISDISPSRNYQTKETAGYYQITASIKIQSGSSNYSPLKEDKFEIFYAPVDQLNTAISTDSPQSISLSLPYSSSLLVTSRSLSGAPYMRTANWEITNSIAGVFDPLYAGNASQVVHMNKTGDSDSIITLSAGGNGNTTLTTSGGSVSTTGMVFTSANVVRNAGTPSIDDTVKTSGSIALNAGSNGATNIVQTSTLNDLDFKIVTSAKNRTGSPSNLREDTINYFDAGTFNQPAASQSMAYYGRAQGYDGSNSSTNENFTGEGFRKQINNALLTVTSANTYSPVFALGLVDPANDLQVKPGYLVKPGGTYKYWIPTTGTNDFRYYAREFDAGGSVFSSMTLNIGKTLVNWTNASTSGIAVGILFHSGVGNGASASSILIDLADVTGGDTGLTTTTTGLNPFSNSIDIKSNNMSSSPSGNTYNLSMAVGKNVQLNSTFQKYIVIIRYKGDLTPVTGITAAYQS